MKLTGLGRYTGSSIGTRYKKAIESTIVLNVVNQICSEIVDAAKAILEAEIYNGNQKWPYEYTFKLLESFRVNPTGGLGGYRPQFVILNEAPYSIFFEIGTDEHYIEPLDKDKLKYEVHAGHGKLEEDGKYYRYSEGHEVKGVPDLHFMEDALRAVVDGPPTAAERIRNAIQEAAL